MSRFQVQLRRDDSIGGFGKRLAWIVAEIGIVRCS